jgi:hypothetical protein
LREGAARGRGSRRSRGRGRRGCGRGSKGQRKSLSKLRRGAGFEWGHRREPGGHLKQSSEGGDNRRRRRASQAAEMLRGSGSTPLFGTVLRGMKVTTGGGVILHRQHPRTPKHSTKKEFHCAMR